MQPEKPALAMDYAKALLYSGTHEACLKVLERTTVLPYEGAWEGRDLYRQAHVLSAAQKIGNREYRAAGASAEKAKLWPENLGVGRPFDVDERIENFILAAAAEKTGDAGKAEEHYESVCAGTDRFRSSWDSVHLLGAIALKKAGRADDADRLLADWRAARGEADPVSAWALAKYKGNEDKAAGLVSKLKSAAGGATWDMGTGDRNLRLVMETMSALDQE
jgi:hypothetical protein